MNKKQILRSMDDAAAAYRDIQPCSSHITVAAASAPPFDVQYYLRKRGDALTITFRGTDSWRDWIADFAFWKKSVPYGNVSSKIRVHTGFLEAYKAPGVRDCILKTITEDIHCIKITGHSMGAALSVLCAVDIEYNFPDKNIEVVLFGCPRVGNKAFKESYDKRVCKTARVENGNDIVTKIPFAAMGFRHVGAKLHLGRRRVFGYFSINDHRPAQYYSSIYQQLIP